MEGCMTEESCVCRWPSMTEMKARENIEGAEVGRGPDLDQEAGGEDQDQGVDQGQGEGLDLDPDPEGDQDPTPEILMKSLKVAPGASKGLKVDPRTERKRRAVLSQVPDLNLNPDPVIEKVV